MTLPEIPGIIEASMTITPLPDGKVSFCVFIGADSERPSDCDLIELIMSPALVSRALADAKISSRANTETTDKPPTFPCHIGLYHNTVHTVA